MRERKWILFDDHSRYVDRFGLLLAVTTLAVIVLSLVDLGEVGATLRSEIGQVVVSLFVGATLLLAMRSSGVGRRFRLVADVVIGLGVLGTVVVAVFAETSTKEYLFNGTPVLWVGLAAIAPLVVVRRLVHHERASRQTLLGAVSAYLLVALAFNFAFLTVDHYQGHGFFGVAEPSTSFMYFSLVTLTTLGYGDLAAGDSIGRLFATFEAVVGQVYLVTFVAMIVGLIVEQRQRERRYPPPDQ